MLLAAAGGVAGLAPALLATAQPAWAFVGTVDIFDQAFSPKITEIEIDDKVLWRSRSDQEHSATADNGEFDYTFGVKGAQEERRFQQAGTFTYHCRFQNWMTGTIVVRDPNAPTTTTTTTTTAPPPPPPTTTTARPTTTTTAPPTTTTAPPSTTTTPAPRPPAEVGPPPVPSTAAAPRQPTTSSSTTTTAPPTTTTTAAPPTTVTSVPPSSSGDQVAEPSTSPSAPPTTEATSSRTGDDLTTAAGRPGRSGDGLDAGAAALISLLVAVGLFGAWTLIRVRPGRI